MINAFDRQHRYIAGHLVSNLSIRLVDLPRSSADSDELGKKLRPNCTVRPSQRFEFGERHTDAELRRVSKKGWARAGLEPVLTEVAA